MEHTCHRPLTITTPDLTYVSSRARIFYVWVFFQILFLRRVVVGLVLVSHDWYVLLARFVSAVFGLVSALFVWVGTVFGLGCLPRQLHSIAAYVCGARSLVCVATPVTCLRVVLLSRASLQVCLLHFNYDLEYVAVLAMAVFSVVEMGAVEIRVLQMTVAHLHEKQV